MTAAPIVPGPVTVRVPAKVNLELLRRSAPRRRLPRACDRLPGREPATTTSPSRVADEWGVERQRPAGRPRPDRRRQPRRARRPPRRRPLRRRRPCTSRSARTSRSRAAWPAARPTPPPPSSRCDQLWGLGLDRDELEELARRARQRRAVPPRRRHRDGLAAAASMLAPVLARGTYHWVFALSEGGLSTPAVYAECDRLRGDRRRARARSPARALMSALRSRATRARSAPRCTTTSRRPRSRCAPTCGELLRRRRRVRRARRHRVRLRARPSPSSPRATRPRSTSRCRSPPAASCRDVRRASGPGPRRPRHPPPGRLVANLVSVERASLALGTAQVLDDVSPRRPRRRPHRRRRPQRRRQDHPAARPRRARARSTPAASPRVRRPHASACSPRTTRSTPTATVREAVLGDLPEHVWAGDPRIRDVLTGLLGGIDAPAVGGLDGRRSARCPVASAAGSRSPRLLVAVTRPAAARRADQPPRRRGRRLARRPPRAAPRPPRQRGRRDHPRPVVPRRHRHADLGGRSAARSAPSRVATPPTSSPRPSASGWPGSPPSAATTCCARSSPGCAAARRRARASRSSASTRPTPSSPTSRPPRDDVELAALRDDPPRQGRRRPRGRRGVDRSATGVLLDHVTWRLAPGERIGIVGVNGAGKSTLLRALAGDVPAGGRQAQGRRDRAPRRAHAGGARARARGPTGASSRPIEDVRSVVRPGRQGDQRRPSSRSGSGSPGRASRPASATSPAASGAGCS